MFIGERYIPGDVLVWVPSHSLFRGMNGFLFSCLGFFKGYIGNGRTNRAADERVFSRPQEFIPERWTTQPELVKDSTVFIPFNGGMFYSLTRSPFSGTV